MGTTTFATPIGTVKFHMLEANTPFLLCLRDLDRLGVYLNNLTNELVNPAIGLRVPVARKWGHPWFFLRKVESSIAFLTETKLRRLHHRFGHPSVDALHHLLSKASHDVIDRAVIAAINKFCHQCQMHSKAPARFRFTLCSDSDFNYRILADVISLYGGNVLHTMNEATAFQAAIFLSLLSAKDTWTTLKHC